MTIKKFNGKTEEEATKYAREAFGDSCVIMNVRMVKPTGLFRLFKAMAYEVTAAIEEKADNGPINIREKTSNHSSNEGGLGQFNLVADEELPIKDISLVRKEQPIKSRQELDFAEHTKDTKILEKRIDHLQRMLEDRIQGDHEIDKQLAKKNDIGETKELANERNQACVKAIYTTLLDNEIEECYINQLIDEMEMVVRTSTSIDQILSTIYQKMILKLGQPNSIKPSEQKPKVIFFIGPTGVGKTTTIAKLASKLKLVDKKEVALLTADTYRIAATEQIRTYANILETPVAIVYSAEELQTEIEKVLTYDYVLVDTAGFSHKNDVQREEMKVLVASINEKYDKEVFLVVSATTKNKDLKDITDKYKDIADYKLIFTKLDETSCYGNLYNIKLYTGAELSYITDGQKVPEDIEVFNTQKLVKKLLGGK